MDELENKNLLTDEEINNQLTTINNSSSLNIKKNEENKENIDNKEIEKKKSTFRLFWLMVVINIILFIFLIYLVIDIFIVTFSN